MQPLSFEQTRVARPPRRLDLDQFTPEGVNCLAWQKEDRSLKGHGGTDEPMVARRSAIHAVERARSTTLVMNHSRLARPAGSDVGWAGHGTRVACAGVAASWAKCGAAGTRLVSEPITRRLAVDVEQGVPTRAAGIHRVGRRIVDSAVKRSIGNVANLDRARSNPCR